MQIIKLSNTRDWYGVYAGSRMVFSGTCAQAIDYKRTVNRR